jgi:hypothetical protein
MDFASIAFAPIDAIRAVVMDIMHAFCLLAKLIKLHIFSLLKLIFPDVAWLIE